MASGNNDSPRDIEGQPSGSRSAPVPLGQAELGAGPAANNRRSARHIALCPPSTRRAGPEHKRIIESMPAALRLARRIAGVFHVRDPAKREDCEQIACQALLEGQPGHDPARGPFDIYIWKRVVGAVTRFLKRELTIERTGFDDALDEAGEHRDTSDPFADEDEDALCKLKSQARWLTFVRVAGDACPARSLNPDDLLTNARALEALSIALGGLEEIEQRLLLLRYWERLTWSQIAAALGIAPHQAKYLHECLRDKLRADLRRQGVEEAP